MQTLLNLYKWGRNVKLNICAKHVGQSRSRNGYLRMYLTENRTPAAPIKGSLIINYIIANNETRFSSMKRQKSVKKTLKINSGVQRKSVASISKL
jgi:predicted transcriptional regulator